MKYRVRRTTLFKKDVKRAIKRRRNLNDLLLVVQQLAEGRPLAARHQDQSLKREYLEKRDCHIVPDCNP